MMCCATAAVFTMSGVDGQVQLFSRVRHAANDVREVTRSSVRGASSSRFSRHTRFHGTSILHAFCIYSEELDLAKGGRRMHFWVKRNHRAAHGR